MNTKAKGWRTLRVSDGEVQVYPRNDLVAHELTEGTCVCGPTPECHPREGESDVWIHVHHSLDGREPAES